MKNLVSLLLISACFSKNPGILMSISPEIVNSVIQKHLPVLEKTVEGQKLLSFDLPITFLGVPGTLALDNILIDELKLHSDKTGVKLTSSRELTLTFPNVLFRIGFEWVLKNKAKTLQTGSAKIEFSEASFLVVLNLTNDSEDAVKVIQTDFKLNKFKVLMDQNKNSAMYNWFLDAFNKKLKKNIVKGTNQAVKNLVIEKINKLPKVGKDFWVPLSPWLSLNLRFLESLKVNQNKIQAKLDGRFLATGLDYETDISSGLDFPYSESGFSVYISESSLNTLSLASYKRKPIFFSSETLGLEIRSYVLEPLFPGIYKDFSDVPVKITLNQTEKAVLKIQRNAVQSTINLECSLFTADQNICKLGMKLNVLTELKTIRGVVIGKISEMSVVDIRETESRLTTPVDIENLKAFGQGVSRVLRSYITTRFLKPGLVLPEWVGLVFDEVDIVMSDSVMMIQGTAIN